MAQRKYRIPLFCRIFEEKPDGELKTDKRETLTKETDYKPENECLTSCS